MSIASAITAAQGRVADCYTSVGTMGGTIPATQNLTNLPAAIESIPTGGGGDTIFLENNSGATISADDKVLFTMGTIGTSTPTSFTHSNNGLFNPILFFDNGSFVTSDNSTGYMHTKVNGVWTSTANSMYSGWGQRSVYLFNVNDIISASDNFDNNGQTGRIYTKTGRTQIPSQCHYIGEYNDVHYCIDTDDYNVYIYDINTNTVGSSVASLYTGTYQYLVWGKIIGSMCFICNTVGIVKAFHIELDGTFTGYSNTTISGYPLFVTTGGYLFVTDNVDAYRQNSLSSVNLGHLFCYKENSDHTFSLVSVPALQMFENTACQVAYDYRNHVLSIGTSDNVYFFRVDGISGISNLNISLNNLPTNTSGYPYRTMMSPDKSTIVVEGYGNYVNVYSRTTATHQIVSNSAYNYNLETSFTGFATGETDSDGKYEVKTVLPEVVDFEIYSEHNEPDEINIYGGAE